MSPLAQTYQTAATHLQQHDPYLAPVITRVGHCTIVPHTEYYRALVESIIGQQLSVKAAATILRRFVALFPQFPSPQQILQTPIDDLRAVGLSRAKAAYVQDLARHILDGNLNIAQLSTLTNHQIIQELVAVKGIGEWTAQMFLMFSLGRQDVLPTGDLGIRNGMMKLYELSSPPTPSQMQAIATKYHWHPYESIASWYIWQSLDNAPTMAELSQN